MTYDGYKKKCNLAVFLTEMFWKRLQRLQKYFQKCNHAQTYIESRLAPYEVTRLHLDTSYRNRIQQRWLQGYAPIYRKRDL